MGKLFFPKMAAGNLVRNRRFVFPYLLTGIITVAMFYNITFLAWHQEIRNMPGGDTIPAIMYLGTIVVGIFSIIFLLYTNSFLIKRRHKEIGLYNILGMSKRHIAVVLLCLAPIRNAVNTRVSGPDKTGKEKRTLSHYAKSRPWTNMDGSFA